MRSTARLFAAVTAIAAMMLTVLPASAERCSDVHLLGAKNMDRGDVHGDVGPGDLGDLGCDPRVNQDTNLIPPGADRLFLRWTGQGTPISGRLDFSGVQDCHIKPVIALVESFDSTDKWELNGGSIASNTADHQEGAAALDWTSGATSVQVAESFDAHGNVSVSGGTVATDLADRKEGLAAVRWTNAPAGGRLTRTFPEAIDLSGATRLDLWTKASVAGNGFTVRLSTDSENYFERTFTGGGADTWSLDQSDPATWSVTDPADEVTPSWDSIASAHVTTAGAATIRVDGLSFLADTSADRPARLALDLRGPGPQFRATSFSKVDRFTFWWKPDQVGRQIRLRMYADDNDYFEYYPNPATTAGEWVSDDSSRTGQWLAVDGPDTPARAPSWAAISRFEAVADEGGVAVSLDGLTSESAGTTPTCEGTGYYNFEFFGRVTLVAPNPNSPTQLTSVAWQTETVIPLSATATTNGGAAKARICVAESFDQDTGAPINVTCHERDYRTIA